LTGKSKIAINSEQIGGLTQGARGHVLIDAGSPINTGSLLNAGALRPVF